MREERWKQRWSSQRSVMWRLWAEQLVSSHHFNWRSHLENVCHRNCSDKCWQYLVTVKLLNILAVSYIWHRLVTKFPKVCLIPGYQKIRSETRYSLSRIIQWYYFFWDSMKILRQKGLFVWHHNATLSLLTAVKSVQQKWVIRFKNSILAQLFDVMLTLYSFGISFTKIHSCF